MAKPPIQVHVQSSEFKKLLDIQQTSMEHVHGIKTLIEAGTPIKQSEELIKLQKEQLAQGIIEFISSTKNNKESVEHQKEQLKKQDELIKINKVSLDELKRVKAQEAEAISNLAKTVETFDTLRDKLAATFKTVKDNFGSMRAFGTTALKAVNIGGIFNKKIAERTFIAQQKKIGSEKTDEELRKDFKERNKVAKDIKKNELLLDKFQKETGLTDKELASTKEGQRLLKERERLTEAFSKTDIRASLVRNPDAPTLKQADVKPADVKPADVKPADIIPLIPDKKPEEKDSLKTEVTADLSKEDLIKELMIGLTEGIKKELKTEVTADLSKEDLIKELMIGLTEGIKKELENVLGKPIEKENEYLLNIEKNTRETAEIIRLADRKKDKLSNISVPESGDPGKTNIDSELNKSTPAPAADVSEEQMEAARRDEQKNELLSKIEKNTAVLGSGATAKPAAAAEGEGGGLLGGLGTGLGALGKGIGKGMESLLSGVGKGLIQLSLGLSALANPLALVGLAAVTLAAMGLGKALEFAAPAIEAFAPVLMKIAEVFGTIVVAAIEKIPEIIRSIGEVVMGIIKSISEAITGTIDAIASSIERLSKLDGTNMLKVGAGLAAIAGGMTLFAGASVVGGIGNLVGGFLSKISGQKTPVQQIIALGEHGENIQKAGIGVEKLGTGLKMFSDIKPENIKAIAALPTEKIAAMGAAMGQAGLVSNQSAANDEARIIATGGGSTSNTSVTTQNSHNITKQNQFIKTPIRNQESSQSKYIADKYVHASAF